MNHSTERVREIFASERAPDARDITYALALCGLTQTDIARRCAVSRSTVSQVIHGRRTSRRIATEIADAVGQPVARLWPIRYEQHKHIVTAEGDAP